MSRLAGWGGGGVSRFGLCLLLVVTFTGCGGEPERSRVVPSSESGRSAEGQSPRPAPGEIRRIEMH
jgi:hypothetical protein